MTPTFSVLLCLGLCLGQRMRTQADRPSLSADKGPLVPKGMSVTLRCRGSRWADVYRLEKSLGSGRRVIGDVKPSRGEGWFHAYVSVEAAGTYFCLYKSSYGWSERSAPLELVVTGLYEPPSLSAWPSSQVILRQQVTLQCLSQERVNWFALYKDGEEIGSLMVQPQGRGAQATFSILSVTPAHGGTYRCYSFHSTFPYEWSTPSDPLVLRVTDPVTVKAPHLPQSTGDPQALTSSPPKISPNPVSESTVNAGILIGISVLLILLFLFLLLFLCHRRRQRQTRLRKGDKEAEAKKTPRSSDPAGTPLEEALYVEVCDNRQIKEARPKDQAAPPGEDPQEVTYAQLNLNSLTIRSKDPPPSEPWDPSLYATLR